MQMRLETPADLCAVHQLQRVAFGTHGPAVTDLLTALRTATPAHERLSLLAEHDGQVLGHVLFTPGLLDAPRRLVPVQVLSPLAVAPSAQGQGIGSALVRRGMQLLAERAVPLVFLEGPPAYYGRLGFVPGGEHGFRKPSLRIPDGAFQVALLPAHEPWMSGTLVHPATWEQDAVGLREPATWTAVRIPG